MNKGAHRYCFTLDLKNDPTLIEKYKWYHQSENIWPEIPAKIKETGIVDMQIYLFATRMFMIMDVDESFSFERMAEVNNNATNEAWEELMWTFQKSVEGAKPGEKWVLMEKIFQLEK